MTAQLVSQIEELLRTGTELVPEGGMEFSGYNAKKQNKYLLWRKNCLDAIAALQHDGTALTAQIAGLENGMYFYHSSAEQIVAVMREALETAKMAAERHELAEAKAREDAGRELAAAQAREDEARKLAEAQAREDEAHRLAAAQAREDEAHRLAEAQAREDEARNQAAAQAREDEARNQAAAQAREDEAHTLAATEKRDEGASVAHPPGVDIPLAMEAPAVTIDGIPDRADEEDARAEARKQIDALEAVRARDAIEQDRSELALARTREESERTASSRTADMPSPEPAVDGSLSAPARSPKILIYSLSNHVMLKPVQNFFNELSLGYTVVTHTNGIWSAFDVLNESEAYYAVFLLSDRYHGQELMALGYLAGKHPSAALCCIHAHTLALGPLLPGVIRKEFTVSFDEIKIGLMQELIAAGCPVPT